MTGSCTNFICLNTVAVLFVKVILQIPPLEISSVADEHHWMGFLWRRQSRCIDISLEDRENSFNASTIRGRYSYNGGSA